MKFNFRKLGRNVLHRIGGDALVDDVYIALQTHKMVGVTSESLEDTKVAKWAAIAQAFLGDFDTASDNFSGIQKAKGRDSREDREQLSSLDQWRQFLLSGKVLLPAWMKRVDELSQYISSPGEKNLDNQKRSAAVNSLTAERKLTAYVSENLLDICPEISEYGHSAASVVFWDTFIDSRLEAIAARLQEVLLKFRGCPIIFVPGLGAGGGELVAIWNAVGFSEVGLRPLVVSTENSRAHWISRLPDSAYHLDLASIGDEFRQIRGDNSLSMLINYIIHCVDPCVVHGVNSYQYYSWLLEKKPEKIDNHYWSMFGVGRDAAGNITGYWKNAVEISKRCTILSDNQIVLKKTAKQVGIDSDGYDYIAYPTTHKKNLRRRGERKAKMKVLWASRLDDEKMPGLVFEIAKLLPHIHFHMYGESVLNTFSFEHAPKNVKRCGSFQGLDSIEDTFDLFLFTSRWEGLPNVILEAMAAGLPIISSNVGAVPEVLEGRGVLVEPVDDPSVYAKAIDELVENKANLESLSAIGLKYIHEHRSVVSLVSNMKRVGLLDVG